MTRSEILQIAKPILFNTEMVRAILDGRKMVTRRVVKPQHLRVLDSPYHKEHPEVPDKMLIEKLCKPPYKPGNYLYVRETWAKQQGLYWHKAGLKLDDAGRAYGCDPPEKWHPSIHMPKEAARIFLRVTDVRVERLHEISNEQIIAEGIKEDTVASYIKQMPTDDAEYIHIAHLIPYMDLWDSTIPPKDRDKYGWAANPFVWVIAFERVEVQE